MTIFRLPVRLRSRVPWRQRLPSRPQGGRGRGVVGEVVQTRSARGHRVAETDQIGWAVAVPWRVRRGPDGGVLELEHAGDEPLHSVRFALAGGGLLGTSLPTSVLPGERLRVSLRRGDAALAGAAPDGIMTVRWFQSDGREMLWTVVV